ncbi:preprotein translocase subunit SecG [Sphingomonas rosea]|jgi:preprotein translocase subunit SecG|uniref:Protein-export membrane protein SecG n=1 Tax=Sphingomonas rosea TaxID=335605 RepID=A0ABP7U8E1_9SPHN
MFTFLLIVQTLVAVSLCTVILLQRSEGGGLGVGGSSAGFMTARGAADFLSRATAALGGLFVVLCIVLAAIAGTRGDAQKVDASIAAQPVSQQAPTAPLGDAGTTTAPPAGAVKPNNAPPADNGAVPLAQ